MYGTVLKRAVLFLYMTEAEITEAGTAILAGVETVNTESESIESASDGITAK